MSDQQTSEAPDARSLLDEHLDAVERVLQETGVSRSERQSICEEVEGQAWEIARQRADAEPGPEHMRMVLAEMDDPAAYMEGAEGGKAEQQPLLAARGVHPFALCSLLVPPVGFVLMLTPLGPRGESAGAVVLIVLGCLALLFGVLGIRAIRQAPQRYSGTLLAVLGLLLIPLIMLNVTAFLLGGDMDLTGIRRAQARVEVARRYRQTRERLVEFHRERHIKTHGRDVAFTPPSISAEERDAMTVTRADERRAARPMMLPILVHGIIIVLAALSSIAAIAGTYTLCRLGAAGCSPREPA